MSKQMSKQQILYLCKNDKLNNSLMNRMNNDKDIRINNKFINKPNKHSSIAPYSNDSTQYAQYNNNNNVTDFNNENSILNIISDK